MEQPTTSKSRNDRAALMWGIIWMVSYFGARAALEWSAGPQEKSGRITVALIPLVPFVAFIWKFIGLMREADELDRRIHLEALAIAFPLAIVLLMILALIQLAMPLNPDDWSYRHVWYLLPILWLGSLSIARRRYQ